jgi:hypothetical protein
MNDEELITTLRQSFAGVRATTPVEQIVSRSHMLRARRRIPRMAGALVAAGGATLALIAVLPASHQSTAQLAAWTVVKRADGTIYVTINQLRDPAGLQRTLRADGVPASVTFFGQENGSCQRYTSGDEPGLIGKVFSQPPGQINSAVIRPSAIPSGAGVQISPVISGGQVPAIAVGIVDASPQCTGS